MVLRAIVSAFFLAFIVQALADEKELGPFVSARACDVLPVLAQIAPNDSPQAVVDKINKMLGRPVFAEGGGPMSNFHTSALYILDDKTNVSVLFMKGKFNRLSIQRPGQEWKVIYQSPIE